VLPEFRELKISTDIVKETFARQFYFDLAGMPFPDQVHGLLRFVDETRLLYGSDFPFTPASMVEMFAKKIEEEGGKIWTKEQAREVIRGNARRLLGTGSSEL